MPPSSSSAPAAGASRSSSSPSAGLAGVEAVVDKDLSAALLAEKLEADFLLMLTDVPAVEAGWGTPEARAIHTATPAELRALDFAAGSMGPKVDAACRFAERTGGSAGIGRLDQAAEILRGEAGTIVAGARYEGTRKPASPTSSSTPAASTAHQP